MNGWMIAFIVWYAFSFGASMMNWVKNDGWVKANGWAVLVGPGITVFLLYMGGAFS